MSAKWVLQHVEPREALRRLAAAAQIFKGLRVQLRHYPDCLGILSRACIIEREAKP